MTASCDFPDHLLHAWSDGEAGRHTARVQAHVAGCADCAARLDGWGNTQRRLIALMDRTVHDVEPLVALQAIRLRISSQAQRGTWGRFGRFWQDVWIYNRRGAFLVGAAAALGAVFAPGFILWQAKRANEVPAVVVESMHVQNNGRAVVQQAEGGNATLIWVEPAPPSPAAGDAPAPP